MRVERELLQHPRLLKLKAISGNPAATDWLLALWGYCQKQRQWKFESMSPDRLADACLAIIDGGKLLTFLTDCRWVRMEGKTLIVCKWDHWNAGLIQRWEAGKKTAELHHATARRPLGDRPPSARAVPRKIDRWIEEEGAVGHKGKKAGNKHPSLSVIPEVKSFQASNSAKEAAYDLNGPRLPPDELNAAHKKIAGVFRAVANSLRSGDKPQS